MAYSDPSEGYDGSHPTTLQGSNNYDVKSFNTPFTFTLPIRPVIDSASYDETTKHIKLEFTGDDIAGFNRDELRKSFSLYKDAERQDPISSSAITNNISSNGRELTIAIDPDIIAGEDILDGQTLYLAYSDPSEGYDGSHPTTLQGSNNYDVKSFNTPFTFTLPVRPVIDSASYDETTKHIKLEFTGDDIAGFNRDELRKSFSLYKDAERQDPISSSAITNNISSNGRELTIAIDPDIIAGEGILDGQTLYLAYSDPSEGYDGSHPTTLQGSNNYDVKSFNTPFTFTLPVRPVIDSASYDETTKHIKLEFTGDDIAGFNRDELRKSFSLYKDAERQEPISSSAITNNISSNGRELTIAIDPDIIAGEGILDGQTLYLAYSDPSEGYDGSHPTTLQGSNNYDVKSFNTPFTFTLPDRLGFARANFNWSSQEITLEFENDNIAGFNRDQLRNSFTLYKDHEGLDPIPSAAITNNIVSEGTSLRITLNPEAIANEAVTDGQVIYLSYQDPSDGYDGTGGNHLQGTHDYDVRPFITPIQYSSETTVGSADYNGAELWIHFSSGKLDDSDNSQAKFTLIADSLEIFEEGSLNEPIPDAIDRVIDVNSNTLKVRLNDNALTATNGNFNINDGDNLYIVFTPQAGEVLQTVEGDIVTTFSQKFSYQPYFEPGDGGIDAPTFNIISQTGNEVWIDFDGNDLNDNPANHQAIINSLIVSWDDIGALESKQIIDNAVSEIVDITGNQIKLRLDETTLEAAGVVDSDPITISYNGTSRAIESIDGTYVGDFVYEFDYTFADDNVPPTDNPDIADIEALQTALNAATADLQAKKHQLDSLQIEYNQLLETASFELNQANENLATAQADLVLRQQEYETLELAFNQATIDNTAAKTNLEVQLLAATSELNQAKEAALLLEAELEVKQTALDNLQSQYNELLDTASTELNQANEALSLAQAELALREEDINNLEFNLNEAFKEIARKQDAVNTLEIQLADSQADLDSKTSQLSDLQTQYDQAVSDAALSEEDSLYWQSKFDQANGDLANAQADLDSKTSQLSNLQTQYDQAVSDAALSEEDSLYWQSKFDQANGDLANARADLDSKTSQLSNLQTQYDQAVSDAALSEEDSLYWQSKFDQANGDLANAQADLDSKTSQLSNLQTQYDQAVSDAAFRRRFSLLAI